MGPRYHRAVAAAGYPISPGRPGWLYGPATDLGIGAGAGYLLSVPILIAISQRFALAEWPLATTLALGLLLSTPHYGATLLRVYERREDRERYRLFGTWASAAIAGLFVLGLTRPLVSSLLITVYFCWSPWHFAGQNYGLSLMFLRRRGVAVPDGAKRALYLAYIGTFLLSLVVFQTQESSATFAPDVVSSGAGYDVLRVGIPMAWTRLLAPLLLAGCVLGFAVAGLRLSRAGAGAADLLPALLLALTQSLWFALPASFAVAGRPVEGLAFTAVWASIAHSAQYLWVTSYYAQRSGSGQRLAGFYAKALLAGSLLSVIPGLAFGPTGLALRPWSGGLAILIFACINLHHFVLDGAVWKLRDGRVARWLLRDAKSLGLAVPLVELWEVRALDSHDVRRVEAAATRLAWIGRERTALLGTLGDLYALRNERSGALAAYHDALAVRRDPAVLNNLAWFLAVRGERDDADEAIALAEEALGHFGPDDPGGLDTLAAAYAAAGRSREAVETAEHALRVARDGDPQLADAIRQRLALYRSGRAYREP
jgi:tetratricopeptide (TPR) repeat protein